MDSCRTCETWTAPAPGAKLQMGVCRRDRRSSHPGYLCAHFKLKGMKPEALGLTDPEIAWIRGNQETHATARSLVRLYRMVVTCPNDPGARSLFQATLNDWRRARRRVLETERSGRQSRRH